MPMEETLVCVVLTKPYLDGIDDLRAKEIYDDRGEVLRDALRVHLEAHGIRLYHREAED